MATTHHTKVLIIGSGPAGYTAAIYTARANLQPLLVQGLQPGGQLTITTEVENYPGFAEPVMGPWLMEQMQKQAEHVGTTLAYDIITDIDVTKRPFVCTGDSGDTYVADTVVVCTGAQARWLGIESEQRYNGRGVSACATCDGFFFRGKRVAVVGGGNSAVEEALYLANIVDKVTVIHRRDSFRAERILQDRLFKHPKVEVVWNHVVDEILGGPGPNDGVTGVRLRSTTDATTRTIDLDGVFVAIGHSPATALFRGKLDMDSDGYLVTRPDSTATNVPGIFAAGDVKDKVYRQAVTAAGMGCMAALEVEKFLMSQ
ncbi:thioredoxin reductase (NADPH) [Azospirillum fermentarium]|uniref:thioredoxin-disulfide reductase n=1 Tax=Azospirillum fermentarium TaxID=1233114 RepID=UPI002226483B|nr:thioredoxin-disulfide reductase [Azospirillum fermentarium]MCW2246192.1 thioredoxin reductase (NADPH) [Azospirillum fermentarium]